MRIAITESEYGWSGVVLCKTLDNLIEQRHSPRRMPQFLGEGMKKERGQRFANQKLYRAMDCWFDFYVSEEEKADANKVLAKYKVNDPIEDTRYYGLFISGKDKSIKIDPIRYDKKVGLGDQQKAVIAKRETHYFCPAKRNYSDYNCNIFRDEIADIRKKWLNEHKPIVDKAIDQIKAKEYTPGDDYKLMCGISGPGAANARAQWATMMAKQEAEYKRFGLKTSMYAQFFHLMASRIEAITVSVLTKNGFKEDTFCRNSLYTFKNKTKEDISKLNGFQEYDETYCIWNFIKHNSLSTYNTLKENYPEAIGNLAEYHQGDLAIYYVALDEELIRKLLDGVGRFFDAYCEYVFNEDVESAFWNHDQYFLKQVEDTIESFTNPLGLDVFDDMD